VVRISAVGEWRERAHVPQEDVAALVGGRGIDLGGTDFGGRRMARKGACSSRGCRSSGGGQRRVAVAVLVAANVRAYLADLEDV
jgi:hypothetical protein